MRGTVPNASAPRLLRSDSWCTQTEAIVIREGFTTPALSISGLEAWCWEGELQLGVANGQATAATAAVVPHPLAAAPAAAAAAAATTTTTAVARAMRVTLSALGFPGSCARS